MDIPDVFHSPFQTQPFDMMTTDFYTSRKQHIDERLQWIRTTDLEVGLRFQKNVYTCRKGTPSKKMSELTN